MVDGDGVIGFVEEHAVVADAKPEQTLELAAQWLDVSLARLGVVMEGLQNA